MKRPLSPGSRAFVKAVGASVRAYRRELRLDLRELADRAGLHPVRIGEIERGDHEPGIARLRLLALGMGLPPSRVLQRVELDGLDAVAGDVLRKRAIRAIEALPLDDVLMLAELATRMQRSRKPPRRRRKRIGADVRKPSRSIVPFPRVAR